MKTRVTIGTGGDYPTTANTDHADVFRQALADGHRWLVLTDSGYNFWTQVNLDDYASKPFLRLQGAGPTMTNIWPDEDQTLFKSSTAAIWSIYLDGVSCVGLSKEGDGEPLCRFDSVQHAYIRNSGFMRNGKRGAENVTGRSGLYLGFGGQARVVTIFHGYFVHNADAGLRMQNAAGVVMIGSLVERNGDSPDEATGPGGYGGLQHRGSSTGGAGLYLGLHLEANGPNGAKGMFVGNARAVRLMNGYQWASLVTFESGARRCMHSNQWSVQGNFYAAWSNLNHPLAGNVSQYYVDMPV
jgi:hypothetical protein